MGNAGSSLLGTWPILQQISASAALISTVYFLILSPEYFSILVIENIEGVSNLLTIYCLFWAIIYRFCSMLSKQKNINLMHRSISAVDFTFSGFPLISLENSRGSKAIQDKHMKPRHTFTVWKYFERHSKMKSWSKNFLLFNLFRVCSKWTVGELNLTDTKVRCCKRQLGCREQF